MFQCFIFNMEPRLYSEVLSSQLDTSCTETWRHGLMRFQFLPSLRRADSKLCCLSNKFVKYACDRVVTHIARAQSHRRQMLGVTSCDDVMQVSRTVRTICSSSTPRTTASRCHGNQASTAACLSGFRCATVKSAAKEWNTRTSFRGPPTDTPLKVLIVGVVDQRAVSGARNSATLHVVISAGSMCANPNHNPNDNLYSPEW